MRVGANLHAKGWQLVADGLGMFITPKFEFIHLSSFLLNFLSFFLGIEAKHIPKRSMKGDKAIYPCSFPDYH